MPSLGTAYVRVLADTKKLKSGLDKARITVSEAATSMRASLNQIAFNTAIVGAAAFGAAMVYNMKKSVDAASDLEEVTAKFGTVFKNQIVYAEKNANALVESYGVSTRAAKEYLSSMQDLLVPMGMASNSAAVLSNEVVKLGIDLGSFNNVETERVMLDIQSALVGNFETMKKYGVVLNATVVAHEAMRMGLVKTKDQITAGIRAQAAYSLMVKGSEAAIGDWARTSGGFANQMKQLTSNIEELRAEIGNNLLPIITPMVDNMNKWIKANKEILAQDMKGWIEGVVTMLKWGAKPIQLWADLWKEIGFIVGSAGPAGTTLAGFAAANPPPIMDGKTGYPSIPKPDDVGGTGVGVGGGDVTAADEGRLAALALIQEREMALWIEQNNRQIELEKELQATSVQQAKEAAEEKLRNYIAYSNAEIKVAKQKEIAEAGLRKQALANLQYTFATMMNLAQGHNRAIFEFSKASATASAIVNTYEGVTKAYAQGGFYGFAMGAAVLAAGMAQVAQIRSQSFDGGGGVAGGAIATPSTGISMSPPDTGVTDYNTMPEEEKRGTLTINIHGDILGDEGYIDMLVDKINAADDRDVFINQSLSARELA